MGNSTLVTIFYVNPILGNDTNTGSRLNPYKSLTRALKETKTPKMIKLAVGTYNSSAELFPLFIPSGVMVIGNEATKGKGILISGSGEYHSESFGKQNITLTLLGDAQLMGVTVTNPTAKGTGVWIESTPSKITSPKLANNTFSHCGREGVFVSGSAKPAIVDNIFVKNNAAGLVLARKSKGEVRRNVFQKNALGIVISDCATPLVANNKLSENSTGIALSRDAQPVLRHNLMEKNTSFGLLVNGNAIPDLGSTQDPGGNIFRAHGQYDLQNLTLTKLVSAGNQLNPTQVKGLFEVVTCENIPRPKSEFSDMAGHWALAFVEALSSRKLMSGFDDGTFAPAAPVTRAQFAAIIAKAFQLPPGKKIRVFTDIQPDFWAASAILRAASMGYFHSFPDGTFRPMENLTKIHAIAAIVNGLKLKGGNENLLSMYRDRAQIENDFSVAIAAATENKIVVNYPQTEQLEPFKEITRAEVAALIHQALVALGELEPIISPYIVYPDVDFPQFTDLVGHWAEPFIRSLISMNLTRGFTDGSYQPDKPMTRAQYSALVAAAFKERPKRPVPDFIDVPKDFWAYNDIKNAAGSGFVGGKSDRPFRPHQNVQRLQVIVSLVNGLALTAASADALLAYNDRNAIPDSARIAVATATKQKIIVNYPDPKQIQPFREATRAEVAAMVYQALVATGKTSAIDSPYIVSHTSAID